MTKLDSDWKKFVAKLHKDHVIGTKVIDSGPYFGLCGMFFTFARNHSLVNTIDGYELCREYCSMAIARYRHKPVSVLPWKRPIIDNPAPRLRFIAHEARRLGIA